jgi:hypothetical protein
MLEAAAGRSVRAEVRVDPEARTFAELRPSPGVVHFFYPV